MKALLAAIMLAQQQPCGPTGQVEKRIAEMYWQEQHGVIP